MPFGFKKVLDHGTKNPIVARLSLQTLTILKSCKIDKAISDRVGTLYLESLQKKLIRCWEINERLKAEHQKAVERYKPAPPNAPAEIPQIPRLEEEAHNFLYEVKNFIRDLLYVFNKLYGTSFEEASEFSKPRKPRKSLVEFAEETFGPDDDRTKMFKEAVPFVEQVIAGRNSVDHPNGHSGILVVKNFSRDESGKLLEPTWHREKDDKRVSEPDPIQADFETTIFNLLGLAEGVFITWAVRNLQDSDLMQIARVPEDKRDASCPVAFVVAPGEKLKVALENLPQQ